MATGNSNYHSYNRVLQRVRVFFAFAELLFFNFCSKPQKKSQLSIWVKEVVNVSHHQIRSCVVAESYRFFFGVFFLLVVSLVFEIFLDYFFLTYLFFCFRLKNCLKAFLLIV